MNHQLALLLALTLLGTACATTTDQTGVPLRIMTWNIRLNLANDGANAWPYRKEAVARIIRSSGADLIGVQEALPDQLADLDAMLPGFARTGSGRDADRRGEAVAIFYRRDRFQILAHDTFWLSETPRNPGSRGWDASYPRIATWVLVRDRATGVRFHHVNTHLDNAGVIARREGMRLLLESLRSIAPRGPVILTGDFNATPEAEPHVLVRDAGFHDAADSTQCSRTGPDSTWNGFKEIEPGRRIDFVYVRDAGTVLDHAILDERPDGRFPSDHLPVLATIAPGKEPQPCPQARAAGDLE